MSNITLKNDYITNVVHRYYFHIYNNRIKRKIRKKT
jgi:hypothetical protein